MRGWMRAALLAALCFAASAAYAQGVRYEGIVLSPSGRPVGGATIRICTGAAQTPEPEPCSPAANLFSDKALTVAKTNPFTADARGNYDFYAAPGTYKRQISGAGLTTATFADISLSDPAAALPNIYSVAAASGTVTAPALAPTLAQDSSANILGTVADGTYYCVYTYANRNGETTASPQTSLVISGGTGIAKFYARLTDFGWITGAYKFRLYCGTSNGGPYFRQTPASVRFGVANNGFTRASNIVTITFGGNHPFRKGQVITIAGESGCGTTVNGAQTITNVPSATTVTFAQSGGNETCGGASAVASYSPALGNDANAIYAGVLGMADFIVGSIVLSGSQPPATNTAAIDPIQVAVNQLHNLSGGTFTLRQGSVQLAATTYTLTTPLICYECVLSGHSMSFQEQASYTGTLITSSWNDTDLGTVMFMGPQNLLTRLGITATGTSNGGMVVGGTTNMNGQVWSGVFLSVPASSTTVAPLRIYRTNVSQNWYFFNVSVNGGRFATHITNASVGPWTWHGGRSNCGSDAASSALTHWAGPVDVQRGAKHSSDPIPSAVSLTWGDEQIHSTESCKGITVDFGGGLLRLGRRWNNADSVHTAGTEAIIKIWSDFWSSGNSVTGFQSLGTVLGDANVLATLKLGPGAGDYGSRTTNYLENFVGGSTGSGTSVCVDFNNLSMQLAFQNMFLTSNCSPDPNVDSSNGKIINVPVGAIITAVNAVSKDSATGVTRGFAQLLDRMRLRQMGDNTRARGFDIDENSPFNFRFMAQDGTTVHGDWDTGGTFRFAGGVGARGVTTAVPANSAFYSATNGLGLVTKNAAGTGDISTVRLNSADRTVVCEAGTFSCVGIHTDRQIDVYNGISTVASGVPPIYAQANLTAQGAAIGATTLYTVPVGGAGQYRICFNAKVTRAATTSSVLGGTNGFQVVYTDQDDSVVVTTPVSVFNSSTANLALNTTQASYAGCTLVNAKLSTNIQYQIDYTSVGATSMQYNLHIRLEKL